MKRKKTNRRTPRRSSAGPKNLGWGFRQAPSDGGKDFGNAGTYATPMAVKSLVREDGQNSLDAGKGREVFLRFRLVELSPRSDRYKRVMTAMHFDQLRKRVSAIADSESFESKLGIKLAAGLEHVLDEKLVLLYVDDYGTHGLQGDEYDSTKPFSALVRDNLNSRKDNSIAGGVFGVGSKVNIACSRLGTVLFASKVEGEERRGTRLIGRSELTYHELGKGRALRQYAGPGWFGKEVRDGVVESIWLPDGDQLLDDLMLRRDQLPTGVRKSDWTGTSILVFGFTDPQTESGATTQQLADSFIDAAATNFWPAMMRGGLTVCIERYVDDEMDAVSSVRVNPRSLAGVTELCDAWEKQFSGTTVPVLVNPGDVVGVSIPLTVSATRPRVKGLRAHQEAQAECKLIVRLADPDATGGDPHVGQVAYVRGRAMVTRYQTRSNAVGGRPFHAALLAGTLVGRSNEQLFAEQFLRLAEPPSHDKWVFNADLGERYARGAKKSLDELHARVTEGLQRALRPQSSGSRDGPAVLKRMLQIRSSKLQGKKQPQIRVLRADAKVVGDAWEVEAELSVSPVSQTLIVTPRLAFRSEGGSPVPVTFARITAEGDGLQVVNQTLVLKPRTKRVIFCGVSDPTSHPIRAKAASAVLDVLARLETER